MKPLGPSRNNVAEVALSASAYLLGWLLHGWLGGLIAGVVATVGLVAFQARRDHLRASELRAEAAQAQDPRSQRWEFDGQGLTLRSKLNLAVLDSVAWGQIEVVEAVIRSAADPRPSFEITAEFQSVTVDPEVEGADGFWDAIGNLKGFNQTLAQEAMSSLVPAGRAVRLFVAEGYEV